MVGIHELLTGKRAAIPAAVRPFDNYEISGCKEYLHEGSTFCETVEDDAEADFWTLYGHREGEGVMAIGDFATRDAAEMMYMKIVAEPFSGSYGANPVLILRNAAPALAACLKDVLSRFSACIADGNGEIDGDREAIEKAHALLLLDR
jgi:hypothetical protein